MWGYNLIPFILTLQTRQKPWFKIFQLKTNFA